MAKHALIGAWLLAACLVAIPSGAAELSHGDFRVQVNAFGVLTEGPATGLLTVDGPLVRLEPAISEWFGVAYDGRQGPVTVVAPGREASWDGRPLFTPVSFESDGRSATAIVEHGPIRVESFLRFDSEGKFLHLTATLTNRGPSELRGLCYTREWRVREPAAAITFPPGHPGLAGAPGDVARRLWMLGNLAPGASIGLTFSWTQPADRAGLRGVEVPLIQWTNNDYPAGLVFGDTLGISFGDFDADGWIDVFACWAGLLWRNVDGQTWELANDLNDILPWATYRYGVSFGDYDNDGLPDMCTEARVEGNGDDCCHLLRNLGGGEYENVSDDPEIVDTPLCNAYAETICWGDVDGDNELDFFIPVYPPSMGGAGNYFLENLGPTGPGGAYRFTERSAEAGLDNPPGASRPEGAQFLDTDRDGDMDLYSNGTLYQNGSTGGSPLFLPMTEAGSGIGLSSSLDEGAAFFDYDLDGDFDLATVYTSPGVKIWENYGEGYFFEAGPIIDDPLIGLNLGLSAEDWDNDGDVDFTTRQVFRRNLFRETGQRHFSVATHSIPAGHIDSATPSWGDWDKDGDLDCALGNWLEVGRFYENVLYSASTPAAEKRHLRIRPLRDSFEIPAGLETEYGTSVEVVVHGEENTVRRKKFTASGHGYLNQNEYTLHFAMPEDPAPGDPDEDVRFDVIADFPNLPAQGIWRVDRHVNPALGDIDLADLSSREIVVYRSGKVVIDGVATPPTAESPLLTTAGGGLVQPAPATVMPGLVIPPEPMFVGLDFDTLGASIPVRLREIILDGQLAPAVACDFGTANIFLWDVTQFGSPQIVGGSVIDLPTSSRNRRSFFNTDLLLQTGRRYRLVAHILSYRETAFSGPMDHGQLTVQGGLLFLDADPCSGQGVEGETVDPSRLYLTVRFGPLYSGGSVVAGPGPAYGNPPAVRVFPAEQDAALISEFTAYGAPHYGVNLGCGDLNGDGLDEILTGPGPGASLGPHVRGFEFDGTPLAGLSFLAYGTNRWGVNVTAGDLNGDGEDEIVTGAGPGAIFGPHVRAFDYHGAAGVTPLPGASFFAYSTRKWGVNVAAGNVDGDGYDEIITGAGPGEVFGPHVRGWNVDGGTASPMPALSYLAYGTHRFGVVVTCGDVDGDGLDEIVTAPGPGGMFGAHIRGWNYDGAGVTPLPGCSFLAWGDAAHGARVFAGVDLSGDGRAELVVGRGPDAAAGTPIKVFEYQGTGVSEWFSLEAFLDLELTQGTNVAAGRFQARGQEARAVILPGEVVRERCGPTIAPEEPR